MIQKTLVLLKPDTVARGLVGEIISRFEKVGLKIIGAKMLRADADLINQHYPPQRREFIIQMGQKTLENSQEMGVDVKEVLGTDDAYEIGLMIQKWNVDFLQSGPVWALVIQGPSAIRIVRKIRGATLPSEALPGTINGDYSFDSSHVANPTKRSIYNLVHASGNEEEAALEIALWFKKEELFDHPTIHQDFMLKK